LIRGSSGAGKSDLALRCLHMPVGPHLPEPFLLVADDQVCLTPDGQGLLASAPPQIRGKLEVRGVGIVDVETCSRARLQLVVDLVAADRIERLPQIETCEIYGVRLPRAWLNPFEASAPIKLLLSLKGTILRQP
jgi:HPr kinase/phosphorylase